MKNLVSLIALLVLFATPCLLQESCAEEQPLAEQEDLKATLQTCIKRVDSLEASMQKMAQLESAVKKVGELEAALKALQTKFDNPPELTTASHFLGVFWFTGGVQEFKIPVSVVPETAREVLILCNVDSIGAGINILQGNVWTQRNGKKFSYFFSSYRNLGNSWNTNSNYWWFPIQGTDRTLYATSTNYVQPANVRASDLGLMVVGYR